MRTSQKKWERLSAVILTFALLLSMLPATAMAASTGDKSIDNEVHYQVNGAIDAGVRYWSIEYDKVDTDGSILLNGSKFADRSNQWGLSNTEPYAGRFLLNFHRVEFYEQIQGVSIVSGNNVTEFDKEANGALWTVPINTRTWASGKIGVVTNSQIRITLKNGQTLESLQLENTPISFETFAVTGSGNPGGSSMMVNRSWDQGFILANNQNRKDEQKTGFLTGPMSNRIRLDYNQLTGQLVIKSIHSFKPNVKMSTTDLYWVVYIKEQIPKELLPYIDTANIRLGATNEDGRGDKPGSEFRTDTPVTIDIDSNGLVDTSRVSAISIAQSDTRDALNAARNRLEKSVFSVATGQNANFTIQYPLRENVSIRDFAIFLNKYITEHDNQLLFDSWLESDYPNEKDGYGLVYTGTLDHGAPYKHLTDSYANAYIPMNDSDKDGLWDFIENQVGSNMNLVDTDGDGVPDGSELLDDSTDPVDAADYKAAAPQTGSTVLYGGIENTIEGTAPKLVYQDPGDKVIEVPVTSQQAGNALVKLQGYDDTTNTFTDVIYGSAVIPFDQLQAGNFRIDLAKDALTAVAGEKVVLVSYSPNGKNPAMGVPLQVLHLDKVIPVDPNHPGTVPDGYVTVTFDTGQGSWKDGTKPSSYYVQKDVEVTPADFQAVTDNLEAPADHIFSKWDGFPENGQFTADEQLTASFADSREIIEVTPKDPDQPFNPENADDGNNSQKTPQGFVRVIFESGEHGTFGTYAGGQDKVKVAYDVKAGQTWEKIAAPAVTAKPGYTAKSGAELWNPQLPGEAETVTGGTYTAQYTKLDKVIPVDPNHPGTVPDGYVTVTFDPGQGSWKDGTKPSSYYVQKDVEVTPADFQAVTDNLEAPADHIFSKWDGFPENGQFTADEQLTASFADSREIIEVTPKDPDQPFNPENADDGNNSQKTPQGFVRVIFESGEHGTFGTYAGGQDKVKVAYDVKAGQTWEKIAAPAVTAKPGYTAKSGAELWNPQLPGEAETVTGGTYTAQYTKLDKVIPVDPNHPGTVPDGYVTVTFDPGQGSWKDGTKPSSYYVQKDVEVTPADFQTVTDNLEAPADHIFSKWDGFPENGQFTADEQLTASFADSREIIEVTPKDPDQPFNPENADDGNNSQKTPQGFVRVIFESGEHGTFGTYAGGQDKVKVAYDVKAGQTWEKIAAPAVTAKPGYTAKSGAELWNPQLPGEAETVTGGTYTAQYTKNSGGKVLWYQEIYLQNPDGTFSRWSYGHGGFAKANTTVRMDLTAFDGQKTAWGDTLGVEYVFDADNAKNRLSDIVENAGKQTPLCAYYKRAPHTVTYQYEGTVPDGAPTVPAKVDSWYGANVSIAEPPTLAGYVFSGWTTDTAGAVIDKGILTMPNTDVVLKGIWTKDVATTAMVTFRIANGTWADGSTADKQILILLHEGKGTLDAADIPTGMKADSGYTGGTWDRQPDTTADAVTGNLLYTYSFHRDGRPWREWWPRWEYTLYSHLCVQWRHGI